MGLTLRWMGKADGSYQGLHAMPPYALHGADTMANSIRVQLLWVDWFQYTEFGWGCQLPGMGKPPASYGRTDGMGLPVGLIFAHQHKGDQQGDGAQAQ